MGQEFIIKSTTLEDKINELLPSQGGFQAGVDLSASTTIIPIVDLTESAEGSNLRADLQSAFSLGSITSFEVTGVSTTIINTTGWFRIIGGYSFLGGSTHGGFTGFALTDGTTTKNIVGFEGEPSTTNFGTNLFDFIVKLEAGDSCLAISANTNTTLVGSTRQLASLAGSLVNP